MPDRPYILLSCALSIDGYLGSAAPRRLELSNDADFDRVDEVRASSDAILVGATTVRTDNPRLLVRSQQRREERSARGLPSSPMKVTVTERMGLDPGADFFTTGDIEKLVYCASPRVLDARSRLGTVATIVDGGRRVKMRRLAEDLGERGVQRLMVEGGGTVHTQFLTDDLVKTIQGSELLVIVNKDPALEQALVDQVTVNLSYTDVQGRRTRREVEPMIFALTGSRWLLVAWCRLRDDIRWFDLGRIQGATATRRRCTGHDISEIGTPPEKARPVSV